MPVNMLSTFVLAREGVVERRFELGRIADPSDQTSLDGYLDEELGLDWRARRLHTLPSSDEEELPAERFAAVVLRRARRALPSASLLEQSAADIFGAPGT